LFAQNSAGKTHFHGRKKQVLLPCRLRDARFFRKSPPRRRRERADKESPPRERKAAAGDSRQSRLHIARLTIMISQHDRKKGQRAKGESA